MAPARDGGDIMRNAGWICALALLSACRGRPDAAPAQSAAASSGDACLTVPGELVATTLGARLSEARPFDGGTFRRCTYYLVAAEGSVRRAFVIYANPAGDYDDLKAAHGGPVEAEQGIGDAAYRYRDADTRRYWITALKRPRVTLQITGDSLADVRKLTILALSRF
jgi:hypothetical protein